MNRTFSHCLRLLGGLVLGLALAPTVTHAQEAQDASVIHACYVPTTGLMYRVKEQGLPQACLAETHVEFRWAAGVLGGPRIEPEVQASLTDQVVGLNAAAPAVAAGIATLGLFADIGDLTVTGAVVAPSFAGDGSLLTNLTPANIAPGTITATFVGDGSGLTGIPASTHALPGTRNTGVGLNTLQNNTTGYDNTATGEGALENNTYGKWNTATGSLALSGNMGGERNTAMGHVALRENTIGNKNTATGIAALAKNTEGNENTATGEAALVENTGGNYNTAIGTRALFYNTMGNNNTATGHRALEDNTGSNNTAVGFEAGKNATIGSDNIFIKNDGLDGDNATIKIGTQGTQTTAFIAGIEGTPLAGTPVVVTATGQLGTGAAGATDHGALDAPSLLDDDHPQYLLADGVRTSTGFAATGTTGAIPVTGPGTRLMWYPGKSAFRAGFAQGTQWDDVNVGSFSTAMGHSTKASGPFSFAMGNITLASGDRSTALGGATQATGLLSTAMGAATVASGEASTAMGDRTIASGDRSTAMGAYASTNSKAGAFVYGDNSTTTVMNAPAINSFTVRAAGGFNFYTASDLSTGCDVLAGTLACTGDLTAAGLVESQVGGFKFPDGTTQTTAAAATGPVDQTCSPGQVVVGVDASAQLICRRPLACSGTEPVPHLIRVAFTQGAAFGLTAPAVVVGTFDIPCSALESDGNKSGSLVSNFSMQVGSQAFEASTASSPNVQGLLIQNGKVTGLAMNFLQDGNAALQMGTNGAVFSFLFNNQGTPLQAPVVIGQKFGQFHQ